MEKGCEGEGEGGGGGGEGGEWGRGEGERGGEKSNLGESHNDFRRES